MNPKISLRRHPENMRNMSLAINESISLKNVISLSWVYVVIIVVFAQPFYLLKVLIGMYFQGSTIN